MYRAAFLVSFVVGLCAVGVLARDRAPPELYANCNSVWKRCWGDRPGCIERQDCAFAAAVRDNTTHYEIMVLNECVEADRYNIRDSFVGVGFDMLDGEGYRQCRLPDLDDFKGFIFWNKEKCRAKRAYEFDWTFKSKYDMRRIACLENREWPEPSFKMYSYLRKHMVITMGDRYPFKFMSDVQYSFRDNLYTNRYPAPFEPKSFHPHHGSHGSHQHYHHTSDQQYHSGTTDRKQPNNGGSPLELSVGVLAASILALVVSRC